MTERSPPTHFAWQLDNMLERDRQMMSIVGSIPWDVSVFSLQQVESIIQILLGRAFATLRRAAVCTVSPLLRDS